MSIFLRKKLSENFTHLPNSLIRDPNLSWKSTGFLVYLLSCADGWQLNFADLSKRKKDGEAATRAAASELKVAGYLLINKIRDEKGRIIAHEWVVSQEPEFQNPDVESPDVDFPHLENRGQRKNNSKSNSFNNKQPQQHSGGDLIFDKAIELELHEKLRKILVGVNSATAQQVVDVLAAQRPTTKSPLNLAKFLIGDLDNFDPVPGFKIANARKNESAVRDSNQVARQLAKDPVAANKGKLIIEACRRRREGSVL